MSHREISGLLYGQGLVGPIQPKLRGPLAERFFMPPMSTLNTREEYWQDRKRRWLALGIKSEAGRADALTFNIPLFLSDGSEGRKIRAQTSIFDPVLSELCYTWWCRPGGIIIDPFAGGSVRGIVASILGYRYWGCELRQEQVQSNRDQLGPTTQGTYRPKWICGDSYDMVHSHAPEADFIFSCPPYGNLECYSDDPADISNMPYGDFLERYRAIIRRSCKKLKDNRFACFVVSEFRDKKTGKMQSFYGDTINAFEDAGLELYSSACLINSIGTGAMRANNTFLRGHRKLVRCHQNVVTFLKGDEALADQGFPETK